MPVTYLYFLLPYCPILYQTCNLTLFGILNYNLPRNQMSFCLSQSFRFCSPFLIFTPTTLALTPTFVVVLIFRSPMLNTGLINKVDMVCFSPVVCSCIYQPLLIKPVFGLLANAEKTGFFSKLVFQCLLCLL